MESAADWNPKVLSEYEIGRCLSAIDAVVLLGKPIAEVSSLSAEMADLEDDLRHCQELAGNRGRVARFWIRQSESRLRYGFYKEPWTLQALDFLNQATLTHFDRDWINGLLFGYRPEMIQEFLDRQQPKE